MNSIQTGFAVVHYRSEWGVGWSDKLRTDTTDTGRLWIVQVAFSQKIETLLVDGTGLPVVQEKWWNIVHVLDLFVIIPGFLFFPMLPEQISSFSNSFALKAAQSQAHVQSTDAAHPLIVKGGADSESGQWSDSRSKLRLRLGH
jgi:hypothetical protein